MPLLWRNLDTGSIIIMTSGLSQEIFPGFNTYKRFSATTMEPLDFVQQQDYFSCSVLL